MALNEKIIPFFEMLVGVAGSGKSTYAIQRRTFLIERMGLECEIVSSDDLREEVWGSASDQRDPGFIFNLMLKRTREYLSKGISVIFDACNVQEKWRRQTLNRLSDIDCHCECVVLIERPNVCVERQNMRSRRVPDYVIWRQVCQFQMPHESEGWDVIDVHCNPYDSTELETILLPVKNFDQRNPHHSCTLDKHLVLASDYARGHKFDSNVIQAALYHDIGKIFTQTFDENDIAHYYNHENVSAYYFFLLSGNTWWNGREVAWLINHHMDFFKGERYLEKLRRNLNDDELYKKLEQLHKCDLAAH
jgi:predicted kinase